MPLRGDEPALLSTRLARQGAQMWALLSFTYFHSCPSYGSRPKFALTPDPEEQPQARGQGLRETGDVFLR